MLGRDSAPNGETMPDQHPNILLMQRLNIRDLAGCADLFSGSFVWHYFNPKLPELEGDYAGIAGIQEFFQKLGGLTQGTFRSEPQSIAAHGDELVVTHVRNTLQTQGTRIEFDAVVVWRVVDQQILEAWDIPSVYAVSTLPSE